MKKVSVARWWFTVFFVSFVGPGLLAPGMAFAAEGAAARFTQLDAAAEQVLNEVAALGAEMAILEETQTLSSENRLLVLVTVDPGSLFLPGAIQLQINERMVAFHQYTETERAALQQGGSHRLFWGNVSTGRHQLTLSMKGRESKKDADFQHKSTSVMISGEGRSVIELRLVLNKDQSLPAMLLREWK